MTSRLIRPKKLPRFCSGATIGHRHWDLHTSRKKRRGILWIPPDGVVSLRHSVAV